jgi:hypothetical protein
VILTKNHYCAYRFTLQLGNRKMTTTKKQSRNAKKSPQLSNTHHKESQKKKEEKRTCPFLPWQITPSFTLLTSPSIACGSASTANKERNPSKESTSKLKRKTYPCCKFSVLPLQIRIPIKLHQQL